MKKLALFLSLVLLVSAFGIAPIASAESDPVTISVTTTEFGNSPIGTPVQEAWEAAMEEMLGREINFEFEFVNIGDYGTKCQLILNTGDLPDILTLGWIDHTDLIAAGDDGMFVELTERWDDLPNYKKAFDGDETAPNRVMSAEGKLYAFYNAQWYPDGNPQLNYGSAVRRDVLAELSLEVPTNLEEFYQVAKAIKEAKPDVYPIFQHEDWENPIQSVIGAYKTSTSVYWNGEEYAYGPIEDSYREVLRYMNKIYTEGLISPDYFTHTQETGFAAVANGNVYMALNLWNGYANENNWGKQYPEQDWIVIPFLSAGESIEEGDWMYYSGVSTEWRINASYSRVISVDSPVIEECLKILDYDYSDTLNEIHTWGVEGASYGIDENGNRYFLPEVVSGEFISGHQNFGNCRAGIFPQLQNQSMDFILATTPSMPIYDIFTDTQIDEVENVYAANTVDAKYCSPNAPDIVLTSDEAEEYNYIKTQLTTVADEWQVKFIKGEANLDTDWEAYLDELNSMGNIEEMLNYYNQYVEK